MAKGDIKILHASNSNDPSCRKSALTGMIELLLSVEPQNHLKPVTCLAAGCVRFRRRGSRLKMFSNFFEKHVRNIFSPRYWVASGTRRQQTCRTLSRSFLSRYRKMGKSTSSGIVSRTYSAKWFENNLISSLSLIVSRALMLFCDHRETGCVSPCCKTRPRHTFHNGCSFILDKFATMYCLHLYRKAPMPSSPARRATLGPSHGENIPLASDCRSSIRSFYPPSHSSQCASHSHLRERQRDHRSLCTCSRLRR